MRRLLSTIQQRRVHPLRGFVLRADTPLADDVKQMIAGRRDEAAGRLAAIRGTPGA